MSREFTKLVDKQLYSLYEELGFVKRKRISIKIKTPEMTTSISHLFATRQKVGHVLVNIYASFRRNDLKHVMEFVDNENSSYNTTGINIGYIMPTADYFYYEYVLVEGEDKDNAAVLEQIKNDIVEYADPFYDRFSSLESIISLHERRGKGKGDPVLFHGNIIRNLPVLYYIQGSKERGLEYIDEAMRYYEKPFRPFSKEDWLFKYSEEELDEYVANKSGECPPDYYFFAKRFRQLPDKYEDWKKEHVIDEWHRKFLGKKLFDAMNKTARQK